MWGRKGSKVKGRRCSGADVPHKFMCFSESAKFSAMREGNEMKQFLRSLISARGFKRVSYPWYFESLDLAVQVRREFTLCRKRVLKTTCGRGLG